MWLRFDTLRRCCIVATTAHGPVRRLPSCSCGANRIGPVCCAVTVLSSAAVTLFAASDCVWRGPDWWRIDFPPCVFFGGLEEEEEGRKTGEEGRRTRRRKSVIISFSGVDH